MHESLIFQNRRDYQHSIAPIEFVIVIHVKSPCCAMAGHKYFSLL